MSDDKELSIPGSRLTQLRATLSAEAAIRTAAIELALMSVANIQYGLEDEHTAAILKRAERFHLFLTYKAENT